LELVEELLGGLSLLVGELGNLGSTSGSCGLVHLSGFASISGDARVEAREEGFEVYILAELGQPRNLGIGGLSFLSDEILCDKHA
jgi:hypothetical protein